MKSPFLSFLFLLLLPLLMVTAYRGVAAENASSPAETATHSPAKVDDTNASTGDAAPEISNATPVPTPASAPSPSLSATAATALLNNSPQLVSRDLPEIHATILLPPDWTLLPGKLLEGDVLLATREKITNENDPWITGLSMTIDRNGAKDSGQKASDYARSLAHEASEKAGDDATPLKESQTGSFHEIRFDFSVDADQPLLVTEVLRANDETGTLAVILWQSPKEEAAKLRSLRENILAGLKLDPAQ